MANQMTVRHRGRHVFDSVEVKESLIGYGVKDYGDIYYVDSVGGSDGNAGKSWQKALATIAAAVAKASAGDVIACKGSFNEAVVVANTKTNLSFIGVGNTPYSARWTAANDAKCLTIGATEVLVAGFRFSPPAYTEGTPAAIQLGNAGYARIIGNRFQGKAGSWNAIYSPVCNSDNVEIADNEFIYMNTATYGAAILGVEAGGLNYSAWKIRRNKFNSCVTAINIAGRVCYIEDNIINEYGINAAGAVAAVLALGIDLSGTNSGGNIVTRNTLGGAYTTALYKAGASGDVWFGNFAPVTATTAPYGLTVADPAAGG